MAGMERRTGYGQYCPIALAAEILTERWVPLLIRELYCGSTRYSQLQRGIPRMSSALLSRRLKELEYSGIVVRTPSQAGSGFEYTLTDAGKALYPIVEEMGVWAQRWKRPALVADENLDPDLLIWDMRRTVSESVPPSGKRLVVQFDFSGVPVAKRRYWLVFDRGEIDICFKNPGFEPQLYISAKIRLITEVWLGHRSLDAALDAGEIVLDGESSAIRGFRDWFCLNFFARFDAAKQAVPSTREQLVGE